MTFLEVQSDPKSDSASVSQIHPVSTNLDSNEATEFNFINSEFDILENQTQNVQITSCGPTLLDL